MAQAVSRLPLTAEERVPAGSVLVGSMVGTRTDVCPTSSAFPCQYHTTVAPYWGMNNRSDDDCRPEASCHPIDTNVPEDSHLEIITSSGYDPLMNYFISGITIRPRKILYR